MQLSLCPHTGAGYQSVFKIHGNHLDTSSLNTEKVGSLEAKYCPSQNSIPIHPKWEKKKQLESWVVLDSRGHSEGAFSAAVPKASNSEMFCFLGWKNPDTH